MRIYKIATLTLNVANFERENLNSIYEVSYHMNNLFFQELMRDKFDYNYFSEFHKVPAHDTITIDGTETDALKGTLNFYVEGIPPDKLSRYVNFVVNKLKLNDIEVGELKKEQSRMWDVPVVRIPVDIPESKSQIRPPEITLSNNNAFFIFNNILKMDKDLWKEGNFNASDLKRRIEYFEGEKELEEGQFAGDPFISVNNESLSDTDFLSGKSAISNYDESKIRNVLNQIKVFCDWAIKNGYETIYVS